MQRLQVSASNALELNCGLDAAVGSMGMSTCGFIVQQRAETWPEYINRFNNETRVGSLVSIMFSYAQ